VEEPSGVGHGSWRTRVRAGWLSVVLAIACVGLFVVTLGVCMGRSARPGGVRWGTRGLDIEQVELRSGENGRIYAMTDPKIYTSFLNTDEVPLTRTRIGAGPEGETVIFGITKADGKHLDKPTAAEDIFDGRTQDVGAFYGEVLRNGRFHVFGEWKDFQDYLAHKEITFTYTEIGTGPKGETVIYALNSATKKKGRPVALVEQFNALHK